MTLLSKVTGWILGGALAALGVVLLFSAPVGGILFLCTSLFLLPPARNFFYGRTGRTLPPVSRRWGVAAGVFVALTGVGIDSQMSKVRLAEEAEQQQLAREAELREEKAHEFLANRDLLVYEAGRALEIKEFEQVVRSLGRYRHVEDDELKALLAEADSGLKQQRAAAQERQLLERLKNIPQEAAISRRDVYAKLLSLRPDNSHYKSEYQRYVGLAKEAERVAQAAAERRKRVEAQFSAWDGSHRGLERLVKQSMNDPDSYEHDQTRFSDKGDHLVVSMTFRGRNGFGGMVRNTVVAKVDMSGNVLEVLSQN
ncbi:hypothetical protein GNE00_03385 [Pseudomonas sp. JL972]|uniref:hypothetical protein n=1 Tax=Stutzerimonas degradans TaxID=2968968 RepID=UPI0012D8F56D|nr:hypothetical protein [Stutzerimonas degradans]MTZ12770.1 hypothetical protein [Stutzerimonas degradans]